MFLWGVATSAYQVEGAEENDWTEWERSGRLKDKSVRCRVGSGHRQRWRSDLALLPTIGANAYRYSVEWSRIEPRPGEFAQEELAREAERTRLLHALAVEPVVTLNHYTHPLWFWREGGWENAASIDRFARLAGVVAETLPRVRLWVTLNEPIVFILGGYLGGLIPPGHSRFSAAAAALEHLLRAHVAASAAIRERIPGARVGIAHNMLAFAPDRPESALDRKLVAAGEALYNDALVEAVATGEMRWSFPGEGSTTFRVRDLPSSTGFFGINYYSRVHLRFRGLPGRIGEFLYRDRDGRGLTDTGWEIHPAGFDRVLSKAADSGLPIIVTENGIATRNDRLRREFLREHVVILNHRRAEGAAIEGYFYWSLLDNFEWLEGFGPRFGLFEVDYATFARRRRPSADLFASLGQGFLAGLPRRAASCP
ncbi:MAG TPA: family 1 glycosylhydrolase [Thermoanaerobaculia bacterium]